MQIGINGPQNKDTKWSISGSGGEKSRSREAEVRFGSLAEASFSTPLSPVAFLV